MVTLTRKLSPGLTVCSGMRRRQFLASGAALLPVVLAGCAHPDVVLDLNEATAEDVADEVSRTADAGSSRYAVVADALENGSATHSDRRELFDEGETVRFEDSFYEVSTTRLGDSDVTVYDVLLDFDPADATPELGEVAFEDLPETDRERLEPALVADHREQEGVDMGVGYGTADEVGGDSVFVPDQQYDIVVRDGDRYRIRVESETETETEFRYEVTEVAPDVETFASQVRGRYLFTLSGLSEAEREVVENAIDGAHFEDSDAFQSVVGRLRDHDAIEVADFDGTWLLEYDGTEYVTYAQW